MSIRKIPYRWKIMFYGVEQPYPEERQYPQLVAKHRIKFLGGSKLIAEKVEDLNDYIVKFCEMNNHWVFTNHTIERLGILKGNSVKEGRE